MIRFRILPLILLCLGLVSCSHREAFRDQYLTAYHDGNLGQAESVISQRLGKRLNSGDYRRNRDAVWLLLERATTRFANGDAEGAVNDYRLALEAMDYYVQDSSSETAARLLIEDAKRAYAGSKQEQLLARVYFALALHHVGDESNAKALLRQAEEWQQKQVDLHRGDEGWQLLSQNGLAKALLAAALDQSGDRSNAEILYHQAEDLGDFDQTLPLTLRSDKDSARVLVVYHGGNIPVRVSEELPGSEALGFAAEMVVASMTDEVAVSSLVPVQVPRLAEVPDGEARALSAIIDRHRHPLVPLLDTSMRAYEELEKDFPKIAGRAAVRMLMRRGLVAAADKANPDVGALADLFMLVANTQTQADIRSWSTLPSAVAMTSFDVEPGFHQFSLLSASSPSQEWTLRLKGNDLCIINVFQIHPEILSVLIPERFQATKGVVL